MPATSKSTISCQFRIMNSSGRIKSSTCMHGWSTVPVQAALASGANQSHWKRASIATMALWIVWRNRSRVWISKGPCDIGNCMAYAGGRYCQPVVKDMVDMPLISQLENFVDDSEVHESAECKRLCLRCGAGFATVFSMRSTVGIIC